MTETIRTEKIRSIALGSAGRIRGIWTPLRRILTFSPADNLLFPQKSIAASIEESSLSVAFCSSTFSKIHLKGVKQYFFSDGRFPQPKDVSSSLALSINEFGARDAVLTLGIPKAWIIIRTAEFPSTIRENIAGVISGEMDRLTPFSEDEALYDFKILRDDGVRLTVLVMTVRTSMVMPYVNDLKENGFTVSGVTASISGLGSLCRFLYQGSDYITIEVGDKEYIGSLFIGGLLTQTLTGVLTTADERTRLDELSGCISSLSRIRGHEGEVPRVVAISGENDDHLKGLLESHLKGPVTVMKDVGTRLGFKGPADEIPYAAAGCAVQALRHDARDLNLLKKGFSEKEKTPVSVTVILGIALVISIAYYLIAPIRVERQRLELISNQISQTSGEAREVEAIKKEIETLGSEIASIERFKEETAMKLDILSELTSVIPDSAWLSKARITETMVEIEGYAGSAIELLPALDASEYFRKVEFTSPTIRDARMNSDRFKIKMEIHTRVNGKGEESDDAKE
jgi:Tfp pilus assembly protein PilN